MPRVALLIAFLAAASVHGASYVGAAACAKCHADAYRKWTGSRHSKMIQPATPASVLGDFTRGQVNLRGQNYGLHARGGAFYVTETYLSGKPREHRVDYTLGSRRIQHYLTTLPDGSIIVLPPSWDVLRKQWFHNFDIGDPDESGEPEVQLWNRQCFSCHVSQEEKNFDSEKDEYKTAWLNFGINCERCHGPGSEHVAHYSAAGSPAGDIVLQSRLDPARNSMVCAQCHSFRDIFIQGYTAGADYYDYFLPILEYDQPVGKDPAYWSDGRPRRFSNDAFGLWQSQCFLKGGATCISCHVDAHDPTIDKNPQLRPDANALCTRCHAEIGKAVTAHTRHGERSAGSSCIECHMPRTVLSIKAEIRDHSMSSPVPENTARHGIPNACNNCHRDRDAAWSIRQLSVWFPGYSRQKLIRRADAFAQARTGDSGSVAALIEIAADPSEGPLTRANAVGYLSRFPTAPAVFAVFERALSDASPIVRAVAALRITAGPADRVAAIAALTRALADQAATVRLAGAVTLVGMGLRSLPGDDGVRFEQAKGLYQARAEFNSDDAAQQLGAGRFYLLLGDAAKAAGALQNSLRLNPETPAQYLLAYAYAEEAKYDAARAILQKILPADPQYAKAQELLKAIAGQGPGLH